MREYYENNDDNYKRIEHNFGNYKYKVNIRGGGKIEAQIGIGTYRN